MYPLVLIADDIKINDIKNYNCDELVIAGASEDILSKRGCCSHHGGVCGCEGDRQKCCDGSLSPSCMCGEKTPSGDEKGSKL